MLGLSTRTKKQPDQKKTSVSYVRPRRVVYHRPPVKNQPIKINQRSPAKKSAPVQPPKRLSTPPKPKRTPKHGESRWAVWLTLWRPLIPLLIAGAMITGCVHFLRRYFRITHVYCLLDHTARPCPASVQPLADSLLGQPLFFTNFAQEIEASHSPQLPFFTYNYYKQLPDTIYLDFAFPPERYRLTSDGVNFWPIATSGELTIQASSSGTIVINSHHEPTNQNLTELKIDPVLHQKFLELLTLASDNHQNWQAIDFYDYNHLEITTNNAIYLLDLFSLDEDLQQMTYLEKYYHPENAQSRIDVRLKRPTVRVD